MAWTSCLPQQFLRFHYKSHIVNNYLFRTCKPILTILCDRTCHSSVCKKGPTISTAPEAGFSLCLSVRGVWVVVYGSEIIELSHGAIILSITNLVLTAVIVERVTG